MLKLHQIKTPVIEVEITPDDVRQYEPFVIARRLESLLVPDMTLGQTIDALREVFAITPSSATDDKVIYLQQVVTDFIAEQLRSKGEPPARPS
jgi:hypothetical protein